MIAEERVVTYIRSLETEECPVLEEIEREALENGVPVVRKETQSLLKTLISLQRPEKILEIGTGAGFSALLMCAYAPEDCRVVTIENYEKRIAAAKENFRRAGRGEQIILIEGDAQEVLQGLEGTFDFVFMDARLQHWRLNLGPHTHQASVLPLSHTPALSFLSFKASLVLNHSYKK